MIILNICTQINSFLVVLFWLFSVFAFWSFRENISKDIETQARLFISYILITVIVLLIWVGDDFISNQYLANVTTEIIGMAITVFLIDRIYKYVSNKNEQLYRTLALKTCRMPIYTYCANWLFIFEHDNKKLNTVLGNYDSLEAFFTSDEFINKIKAFDFNKYIGEDKTYAQYYDEKMAEIKDRFQSILVKYASKLSHKDLTLLEHFGGKAYMFSLFALMKFLSETKFTHQRGNDTPQEIKPFNNCFKDISNENLSKHFIRLVELINEYNSAVDNDYEKWTIRNISVLNTLEAANNDPMIDW